MKITYRILQPADAGAYRRIRLESLRFFPGSFGSTYEEESVKHKLAFETFMEQQTAGKFIAGAFEEKTLIGICGFARDNNRKNEHKGTVIQMYMQPQYSGRGIGLQLLQTVINKAFELPGMEQLLLGVIATNKSAVTIYEKAGFKVFGVHKNYFKEDGKYLDQQFMILYKDEQ